MLERKIDKYLREWKDLPGHKPLIVKGCRQCGKTFSVLKFARENYRSVVYVNFVENRGYASAFSGKLDVDSIMLMLSALLPPPVEFVPGETVFVFDEIQECPNARTALKFFCLDGRFDVICTGSLLGVSGYRQQPASIPVGYETVYAMHPLDFEEFILAHGIGQSHTALLAQALDTESPVPEALHSRMRELLLLYAVTGGMPEAVQCLVQTKNLSQVLQIQRDIVRAYLDDMIKYADAQAKPLIRECFLSLPKQLSRENKKFQYALVRKGGTASRFSGSLQWLEHAGIIVRCYNLSIPELPLDGNALPDRFKVYMHDTGLFISMLEDGTQADILRGNLLAYKGAVFENLAADILSKMDRSLYYYHKDSGLEIDFVLRYRGECFLMEVKATTGDTKSAKTILAHKEKYHVAGALKFGDYNVGRNGRILTLPLYMMFLLKQSAAVSPMEKSAH
ncbi:MAG: ATP-binding protein [Mailhella sp.]|nr:ATP-binding protein [Mailhella sp.]